MSAIMGRTTERFGNIQFMVDPLTITRNSGRQIDWDQFDDSYRQGAFAVAATANAAIDATAISVAALPKALPAGATLRFGAKKFARLTAAADAGATEIAVEALATAVASGDTATYFPAGAVRIVKAGTPVGDKAGNGKLGPRVQTSNPAIGLLVADAVEGDLSAAATGYGVITGGDVYENLIPGATGTPPTLAAAIKTELNANGRGFSFEQYSDSRS